ncbi:hypothetical protein [Psychrosphaera haliotis]|uniref:START domain-containing protein n=1 Tax=Psychrosphaera haliotis TaxID=555083 RepID=A0A6N8F9U5_9GAMM|nr:hypothetical protein [Psychrosphaera haliotis]MUH73276.1 hypothetical protein [Psychrosphaera haliotis]
MQYFLKFSGYLLVLLLAGLWLKPQATFDSVPVMAHPWVLKSTELNESLRPQKLQKSTNGHYQFSATSELINVTPRMLHWFYQNQIQNKLTFNGQSLPWFKLAQPRTLSNLFIVTSPEPQNNRLLHGVVFQEQSSFDDEQWQMRYKIRSFGDEGLTLDVLHAGYAIGSIEYKYTANKNGTSIQINGSMGMNVPIIGGFANFYLFNKVYPSRLLDDWFKSTLESYRHMDQLIPILYSQKHKASYSINS